MTLQGDAKVPQKMSDATAPAAGCKDNYQNVKRADQPADEPGANKIPFAVIAKTNTSLKERHHPEISTLVHGLGRRNNQDSERRSPG
jgi:hypothetical protein